MGRGKAKSFKPHGKDKSKLVAAAANKKAAKKSTSSGIIRGRVETPKTERKKVKRIAHQLQTIAENGVDVDAIMKDIGEDTLTKAQRKKLQRKAQNQNIKIVEEEVKNQMDLDAQPGTGTELGAPF